MSPRRHIPEVVCAMVGTAGHIDHGKTELVRMLTGCDTDRLREEKERGMSIDLGFAPYTLADGRRVGIVDVPGHKEFIRNMVAGAASIDVLMLVIAADDGVMPQTDEHLRILKVMRMPRVMVALTKIDLVDAALQELARQEISEFMTRLGFPGAPIVPVSNKTLEGLDQVRAVLERMVMDFVAANSGPTDQRAFRMNIERTFTVKGYGTVVTGIPTSGVVAIDDKLEIVPGGQATSLRAVQMFKLESTTAYGGACAALNLRDVELSAVARGMAVVGPGLYPATRSLIATLENISQAELIKHRRKVKLHVGTAVTAATVALLGRDVLEPGEQACAQLNLDDPLVAATGDRFLIRQLSPPRTIGGGMVLSTEARRLKRSSTLLHETLLRAEAAAKAGDLFGAALLAAGRPLYECAELLRLTHSPAPRGAALLAEKEAQGEIVELGGGGYLVRPWLSVLVEQVRSLLARHHRSDKLAWGMAPAQACAALGLAPKNGAGLAEELARAKQGIIIQHGCLALAAHQPALGEKQRALKQAIASRVDAAAWSPPARGNLMSELGASEADMSLVVRLLADEGVLAPLGTYLCSASVLERCRERLLALFEKSPVVDVNAFRQATGTSRRLAVAILESFDEEGFTRRESEGRVLAARARNASVLLEP